MKFIHLGLLCASLIFSGCALINSDDPYATNDFEPIDAGKSEQAIEDDRPLNSTLAIARSTDSLIFDTTNDWISDQAHLPDAVVDSQGRIFLYYTGWIVGDKLNRSAVAISNDQGESWTYKYLTLTGSENYSSPLNPDIVLLEDGTFRLYYTAHAIDYKEGIHYAESVDGLNFEYKGQIFNPAGLQATNSTTFKIHDTWHLFAETADGPQSLWHLTSTDGVIFEVYALTSFPMGDTFVLPNNGIWIGEKFHLFVSTPEGEIKSWSTKNGYDWYPDDGIRLSAENGHKLAKDATIVELKNGSQLMIYTTDIID
jgi:hypothetical protein